MSGKPISSRVRKLLAPSRLKSEGDEARAMSAIRTHLLTEGLGEDVPARPLLWKLLLGVPGQLDAQAYAALVAKGASPAYSKVRRFAASQAISDDRADPQRHLSHPGHR